MIAVCNKKGGVGKTTTSVNLAAALAEQGSRVLLVDLGPQRNATTTLCPEDVATDTRHLARVVTGELSVDEAVFQTAVKGLEILPASLDMESLKLQLNSLPGGVQRLKRAFKKGPQDRWDYVFFDCPPTIEHLTVSGIVASGEVLIVLEPGAYAIDGLDEIWRDILELKDVMELDVGLLGVVFNKVDKRTRISREVEAWIEEAFAGKAFSTKIPDAVAIKEAPFSNQPVLLSKRYSAGAEAFRALAIEVAGRAV